MPSDTETSYISTCERQADVNMEINFGVISPENAYYKIVLLKYYLALKIGKNNQLNTKLYKNVTLRILTVFEHTKKNILQFIFDNHTFGNPCFNYSQ